MNWIGFFIAGIVASLLIKVMIANTKAGPGLFL